MTYAVRRSARAKKIKLVVKSDGKVELVMPKYVPLFMGKAFATLHEDWIAKQTKRIKNQLPEIPTVDGSAVPFLGKTLRLQIQKGRKNNWTQSDEVLIVHYVKKSDIKKSVENFYRTEAKKICTKRSTFFAERMGLKFGKITIRNQKTRWGSCSSKGNLNFNWKIVKEAPNIIDYLVIHEVCHLQEMNHSKRFWKLVENFDPEYKKHAKYLKGRL